MKKRFSASTKSFCLFIFAALLFLMLLPCGRITAAANAPASMENMVFLEITLNDLPEGSYVLDVLVPEDAIRGRNEYTECNTEALSAGGFAPDCELVSYRTADDCVSYLAHDTEAEFEHDLERNSMVLHYSGSSPESGEAEEGTDSGETGEEADSTGNDALFVSNYFPGYELMAETEKKVHLAVVDREGNVLNVSEGFRVYPNTFREYYGTVTYDAADGSVIYHGPEGTYFAESGNTTVEPHEYPDNHRRFWEVLGAFLLGLIALIGLFLAYMCFTVLVEFLVALCFKLKPAVLVLPVNVFSNLVFNILLVVLCVFYSVPYTAYVIVGEIIVTLAEYLVYTKLYDDFPKKTLLLYSIAANFCSMGLTFLFLAVAHWK